MTQAFFLAILLLGFIAFALMWLLGLHIKFELTFKTLATVFVMLPLLVIPALLVFVIGFGLYMLVHATGLLPSIPDRYVLWALIAQLSPFPELSGFDTSCSSSATNNGFANL